MDLGNRLRLIRRSKNLTLDRVHELTNISRATLSQWENNKALPGMGNLEKWAKGLGIDVWDIFFTPSDFDHSPDEIQLIESYRQLSPANQGHILAIIKSLSKKA